MNKPVATLIAGSVICIASLASADDATVVAERRALKPGPGLLVVDTTIDVRVGRASVKDKKGFSRPGGWQPTSLEFDLWGKSDSANAIVVKWKDGTKVVATTECPAPDIDESKGNDGNFNDQEQVRCQVKDGAVPAIARTGSFQAEIYLRAAGKPEQLLRTFAFAVGSVREIDSPDATVNYYVDHDYKLAETVGFWDWDAGSLHLRAYVKQDKELAGQGKLRCTVNGTPITRDGWLDTGGGMSLSVHDGAHDKDIHWQQLEGVMDLARQSMVWVPGKYECQMIHSAKVLRTIRFQLDAKKSIVPSPEQQARPGAIVSRTTYLPDYDMPSGIDLPFSRGAFGALALSGRPWLGSVPPQGAKGIALAVEAPPAAAATTPVKAAKGKAKGKAPKKK